MQSDILRFPTFAEAALPASSRTIRLVEAFAFSLLIALCAQIHIPLPFSPVPITGQTFAVLYAGALLGSRWGAASVLMYLMEGSIGLPFFAGGAAGFALFLGPTGGYLMGFIPAAWLVGKLAERGWDRSPFSAAGMMLVGSLPIFALGLLILARFVPPAKLLASGLWPFIPGDLFKACVSAAALPLGWRFLNKLPK